ncbi:unnamed protein product [Rangifer tarandus platyrhynchus]|uniref:Uncharacterized protein n=2 Tax=Rangifer tarandus platyrhynchus TaxID=3082113 RepID=A0ACB0EBI5_RANTA|nr:unnamed protein product [Rangifer tarandus platyrhynchus]CAI9698018.1 unnamed protein product [Rangifer tarandus platyrhynchus]
MAECEAKRGAGDQVIRVLGDHATEERRAGGGSAATKVCGRWGAAADAPLWGLQFTLLQPAGSPRWKRSVSVLSSVTAIQEVPTRPASSSKAAERVLPGAGECAASEEDLPRRPE